MPMLLEHSGSHPGCLLDHLWVWRICGYDQDQVRLRILSDDQKEEKILDPYQCWGMHPPAEESFVINIAILKILNNQSKMLVRFSYENFTSKFLNTRLIQFH